MTVDNDCVVLFDEFKCLVIHSFPFAVWQFCSPNRFLTYFVDVSASSANASGAVADSLFLVFFAQTQTSLNTLYSKIVLSSMANIGGYPNNFGQSFAYVLTIFCNNAIIITQTIITITKRFRGFNTFL